MANKYIERLTANLNSANPDSELIANILDRKRAELGEAVNNNEELDSIKMNEAVDEIISLLYQDDKENAQRYGECISLTESEMTEVAKVTFDIAKYKNETDRMFNLIHHFQLGNKRIAEAVLPKMYESIKESKHEKAVSLKNKYKDNLPHDMLVQYGMRYFNKEMTFEKEQIERSFNYRCGSIIKNIFKLDDKMTSGLAEAQYEYSIINENFEQAVDIVKKYHLSDDKLKKAVAFEFKRVFYDFVEKLKNNGYVRGAELSDDDPYKRAVTLITESKLIQTPKTKDKAVIKYIGDIKNSAYNFLERLVHSEDYDEIDLIVEASFCANIICDFRLTDSTDKDKVKECEYIISNVLSKIDQELKSVSDAFEFHEMLAKIYKQSPTFKVPARKVGIRIFEVYLDNNQLQPLQEIYGDLELTMKDVFLPLKKKSLEFIEKKDMDSFNRLANSFDIVPRLNGNDDFLMKLYQIYRDLIYANELQDAIELTNKFRLSFQKKLEPLKAKISDMLLHNKDDEALSIIRAFNIKNNQIRNILVRTYLRRVDKEPQLGS
ncbi:hypothetical protein KAS50_07415, partial [bacterium]|nr:hypothetical protein [bacterium]